MSKRKEQIIRVCLLGPKYSGKTCLCSRFVNSNFEWLYEPTEEARPYRKLTNITGDEDNKYYCQLLVEDLFPTNHPYLADPEQSEEAKEMSRYFDSVLENKTSKKKGNEKFLYKEHPVHAYMFVFDLTDKNSFEDLKNVVEYIDAREEKEQGRKKTAGTVKVLVGTKADLKSENAVAQQQVDQFSKKYKLLFRKVSALQNSGVEETFLDLAMKVMDSNQDSIKEESDEESGEGVFGWCGCTSRSDSSCLVF